MTNHTPEHVMTGYAAEHISVGTGHAPGYPFKVITSLSIDDDSFLQNYHRNVSQNGSLPVSFRQLGLDTIRTFRISLTKEEQEALSNSTMAKKIQEARARNTCKPENLLAKGPVKFLPDYKSPCWYTENQRLLCLPYFLLIGAPKSGTTDLFNMLRLHPDYQAISKEFNWLTKYRFCWPTSKKLKESGIEISSFDWYAGLIGMPLFNASKSSQVRPQEAVTGDLSTSTSWRNDKWSIIEENILPLEPTYTNPDFVYHLYNGTKILAILRNPIDRLYSDFVYFNPTNTIGPREFHQRVVKSIDYFNQCMEIYSVRSCFYNAPSMNTPEVPIRLHVGLYFIYLLDWYRVFPRDQILILRLEDYTNNRARTALKIYNFLNLRKEITNTLIKTAHFKEVANSSIYRNSRNNLSPGYKETMFEETRYLLYTFYKPFNQALAKLLNDSSFDYGPY